MKNKFFILVINLISVGCSKELTTNQNDVGKEVNTPASSAISQQNYYQINGFCVFPLENIPLGSTCEEVRKTLGTSSAVYTKNYHKPSRVKLSDLPEFDEQWGYFEGLATNWVFFFKGNTVAAFREESDF